MAWVFSLATSFRLIFLRETARFLTLVTMLNTLQAGGITLKTLGVSRCCYTNRVDHPEGLNIAFTDSIPLAALFFKSVDDSIPQSGFRRIFIILAGG